LDDGGLSFSEAHNKLRYRDIPPTLMRSVALRAAFMMHAELAKSSSRVAVANCRYFSITREQILSGKDPILSLLF